MLAEEAITGDTGMLSGNQPPGKLCKLNISTVVQS